MEHETFRIGPRINKTTKIFLKAHFKTPNSGAEVLLAYIPLLYQRNLKRLKGLFDPDEIEVLLTCFTKMNSSDALRIWSLEELIQDLKSTWISSAKLEKDFGEFNKKLIIREIKTYREVFDSLLEKIEGISPFDELCVKLFCIKYQDITSENKQHLHKKTLL